MDDDPEAQYDGIRRINARDLAAGKYGAGRLFVNFLYKFNKNYCNLSEKKR